MLALACGGTGNVAGDGGCVVVGRTDGWSQLFGNMVKKLQRSRIREDDGDDYYYYYY